MVFFGRKGSAIKVDFSPTLMAFDAEGRWYRASPWDFGVPPQPPLPPSFAATTACPPSATCTCWTVTTCFGRLPEENIPCPARQPFHQKTKLTERLSAILARARRAREIRGRPILALDLHARPRHDAVADLGQAAESAGNILHEGGDRRLAAALPNGKRCRVACR